MISTKIFGLMKAAGYASDSDLADAMGISKAHLSKVKSGQRQPGSDFIQGALRAFAGKTFDDLFVVEPDPQPSESPGASERTLTNSDEILTA